MKVGSISGAWMVGGRKGVGVGAGEQAEMRKRVKTSARNCRRTLNGKRLKSSRSLIRNKKGATHWVAPTGHLYFFLDRRGTAAI